MIEGTVIAKNGPVSFEVDEKGNVFQRHLDQIRFRIADSNVESAVYNETARRGLK